ncbi:MAG: CheC domain protein [Fibrobacteres bacterium]|nr:CheC domain protein [Fibrobacterota bacterium]
MGASVRVEHINPFIEATVRTFQTMVYSDAHAGKVVLMPGAGLRADVSGIIGLSGMAKGSVSLSFSRITALKVVSAFVGARVLALDDTVTDAIGELASIVAGAAKSELSQYRIQISLPSIILGGHELAGPGDVVPMVVPFQCPQGTFNLVVRFKSEG